VGALPWKWHGLRLRQRGRIVERHAITQAREASCIRLAVREYLQSDSGAQAVCPEL